MTTFGETPAEAERVLTTEEVVGFREDIVWPSIKWLKRGFDFMREAPVGSAFSQYETIVVADNRFTVGVQATIYPLDEDDPHGRVGDVRCVTEFAQPNMTDSLITIARQEEATIDQEELEQGLLLAWEVTEYDITDSGDRPFVKSSHYELQDSAGEVVWSSEGEEGDTHDLGEFEVIEELFGEVVKTEDATAVQIVFSCLGVPEEITFPE